MLFCFYLAFVVNVINVNANEVLLMIKIIPYIFVNDLFYLAEHFKKYIYYHTELVDLVWKREHVVSVIIVLVLFTPALEGVWGYVPTKQWAQWQPWRCWWRSGWTSGSNWTINLNVKRWTCSLSRCSCPSSEREEITPALFNQLVHKKVEDLGNVNEGQGKLLWAIERSTWK